MKAKILVLCTCLLIAGGVWTAWPPAAAEVCRHAASLLPSPPPQAEAVTMQCERGLERKRETLGLLAYGESARCIMASSSLADLRACDDAS